MIKQKVSCPKCKKITTINGHPNETVKVICPYCHTKGFFQLKNVKKGHKLLEFRVIKPLISFIIIFLLTIVSILFFYNNDFFLPFILLIVLTLYLLLKFDIINIFISVLFFLIIGVLVILIYNDEDLSQEIFVNIYWLIVVGVCCYLIGKLKKLNMMKIF